MRKILILLLFCQISFAQYNLFARQNFAYKVVSNGTNTEIGGVASTISTPALLASKLGILESRITNFSIVGSDIKCKITGNYNMPSYAFLSDTSLTFFKDIEGKCTYQGLSSFKDTVNCGELYFPGVLEIESLTGNYSFSGDGLKKMYYPACIKWGSTNGVNDVFSPTFTAIKNIYVHPSMATINAGVLEGDLAYAVTKNANIVYVTNFTPPNPVTTLASGTVYNTAIQLNFTTPIGSANSIEHYECYANGVRKNNITSSGQFIAGLSTSTSYNITIISVDIFLNRSVVSNVLVASTNTASAVPTTGLISYYKLNETSGITASDSFGSADLTNTGVTINQIGKVGQAYQTTGSSQKLQNNSFTAITGNFTMNLWVYISANQTIYSTPLETGNYGANSGFGFLWDSQRLSWRINQNYNHYSPLLDVIFNSWAMITMTYDGANVRMYINGDLKTVTANTANPSTSNLLTAFYRQDQGQQMIGKNDEISIYNVALTQNQIDILYNSGNGTTL